MQVFTLQLNEFSLAAGNEQHPFIKWSGDRCSALHGLGQACSVWTGNKFISKSHSVAIDLKEMKAVNAEAEHQALREARARKQLAERSRE